VIDNLSYIIMNGATKRFKDNDQIVTQSSNNFSK